MFTFILNQVIGPVGRAILDFYFDPQHLTIINSIFLIWAVTMTYGSYQLNKIRHITVKMAVESMKQQPNASNEQIWADFLPYWSVEIEKLNIRLILNRRNLWVTTPTTEKLVEILRLGPDWFEAIRNGEVLKYRFAIPGKNDKLSSF